MYQAFIGLETHIRLATKTKVFCSCKANYGDEPNTNVCPVCMGYPGTLPTLNREAMTMGYALAKALNCQLAPQCGFERKNYFYPDLPKNYQISQFTVPLGQQGWVEIECNMQRKKVRIRECHLEEDAGKMIHAGDMSLLDYNRTGFPLLEVVTEPDLDSGEEAEILLQELRRIVRFMGICDGNMEEGSLKSDANVSVNLKGQGLGRKVEIKNLNSSRFIRKSMNHEIQRQIEVLKAGGTVSQETRLWNENRDQTEVMRSKENASDYRYFPEPDLPPFKADQDFLAGLASYHVELPLYRRQRMIGEYGLQNTQAEFICDEKAVADYFEEAVRLGADAQTLAAWMAGDIQKKLNQLGCSIEASVLSAQRVAQLLSLMQQGRISGKIAKKVLDLVFDEDKDPTVIVKEQGLEQISDPGLIKSMIEEVLKANPKALEQIAMGDHKPLGFLAGQVLRASAGKADPALVQELLGKRLGL